MAADLDADCMTTAQPKKLGPFLATMFVTGNMVGSGLFLLPATLGTVGGISVFAWGLATAGALLIAGIFARLGVLAPWAGGPYAYARATLGRYFGFQTNYVYWISCWVGNVGIALAVTGYVEELFPVLKPPLISWLVLIKRKQVLPLPKLCRQMLGISMRLMCLMPKE